MSTTFIDKLVDWRAFERFVRDLHAQDPDVQVEHDVTLTGASGAKRQIDVKLTHTVGEQKRLTLLECKRWKEKVDRSRIDVLAASIEDLAADGGVMFTTTGYEEGAEVYARHKGIELFVVRDLTEEEWGRPGREVRFHWHLYAARFESVKPGRARVLSITPDPPENVNLSLVLGPKSCKDPELTLYTGLGGEPGANLAALLLEGRRRILELISGTLRLFANGQDKATKSFLVPFILDLSNQPPRHLIRRYGAIELDQIAVELLVNVSQTHFRYDRGAALDIVLAVENFITRQRSVVTRTGPDEPLTHFLFGDPTDGQGDGGDAFENDSLLAIFTEPWVNVGEIKGPVQRTQTVRFRLPDWGTTISRPERSAP